MRREGAMRGQGAVVIALRLGLASKYLEKEHRTELSITPSSEDGIRSSGSKQIETAIEQRHEVYFLRQGKYNKDACHSQHHAKAQQQHTLPVREKGIN
jgi:hypothetical protein